MLRQRSAHAALRAKPGQTEGKARSSNNPMTKIFSLFAVVVTVFSLAACDSSQENARENTLEKKADTMENQADATRQSAEAKADGIESAGQQGADKSADAVRKEGEAKADGLENQADATREQK